MQRNRSVAIAWCLAAWAAFPGSGAAGEVAARLVVVAPQAFHPALTAYLEHKGAQMPVDLIALEAALKEASRLPGTDAPAADAPEQLKRRLYREWKERGARYVLLVGDADVIPVRYMVLDRVTAPAFDYAFYPSDLYYADLAKADGSFEDWNARKDGFHAGYYGEVRGEKNKDGPINFDAIHYLPEIAVGRWPVSTAAEVEVVAAKTIRYEQGLAGKAGARRAAFVVAGGWVDARPLYDRLAASLPAGWTSEKLYYQDGRRGARLKAVPRREIAPVPATTPPPTAAEVVRLLNEGLGFLVHAGHGQDDFWEGSLGLANLAALRNGDRLPIVISAGCSTARFATLPPYESYLDIQGNKHRGTNDGEVFKEPPPPPATIQTGLFNRTGLGEGLLRRGANGAVAYIGCNTGSQPCGLSLIEGFVEGIRDAKEPRLGDAWNAAIAHYWKKERLAELRPNADWYPPSIFFQGMKFMAFGDPSLLLPRPGEGG